MRVFAITTLVLLLAACGEDPAASGTSPGGGGASDSGIDAGSGGTSGSAGSSTGGVATGGAGAGGADAGPTARVWGVTVDSVDALPDIVASLGKLPARPTTRIVFDELVPATSYSGATKEIHAVSDVMGEILDSFYVSQYSVSEYTARTQEYLDLLSSDVDIWEIGNEVNGEWLCAANASSCSAQETKDVVAKIQSAHDLVVQHGGKTALTLYYNQDCWSDPANEMFTWTAANLPPALRQSLDYVLVSYYEDDCNGLQPDWESVFTQLATLFPSSKLGVGECGTLKSASKAEYVNRYYTLTLAQPRFVGGFFWWYYREDMVPYTQPLFATLSAAISSQLP